MTVTNDAHQPATLHEADSRVEVRMKATRDVLIGAAGDNQHTRQLQASVVVRKVLGACQLTCAAAPVLVFTRAGAWVLALRCCRQLEAAVCA